MLFGFIVSLKGEPYQISMSERHCWGIQIRPDPNPIGSGTIGMDPAKKVEIRILPCV